MSVVTSAPYFMNDFPIKTYVLIPSHFTIINGRFSVAR